MNFPATGLVSIVQGGDYAGDVMLRKNRKIVFKVFSLQGYILNFCEKNDKLFFLIKSDIIFALTKLWI